MILPLTQISLSTRASNFVKAQPGVSTVRDLRTKLLQGDLHYTLPGSRDCGKRTLLELCTKVGIPMLTTPTPMFRQNLLSTMMDNFPGTFELRKVSCPPIIGSSASPFVWEARLMFQSPFSSAEREEAIIQAFANWPKLRLFNEIDPREDHALSRENIVPSNNWTQLKFTGGDNE